MSKMYDFKQAVRVGRQVFPLGIRQVPPEMEKHPHFQQFLKAGSVKVAGASQVEKKLSDLPVLPPASSAAAQRSQVAAEAIQQAQPEVAPEVEIGGEAEEAPVDAAPEASDEASDEAPEEKSSKGKKGRGR